MTKKAAAEESPKEFDWLSLAQPTTGEDAWEVDTKQQQGAGPFWVQDEAGNQFATHVIVKGLKPLDESPFDRSGELRSPTPGGIDTAPAE